MKMITANLLRDGRVAYLSADGAWVGDIDSGAILENAVAETELSTALERSAEIADAYLIDVEAGSQPAGRARLREAIRSAGPTARTDLGKQAGSF